MLDLIENVKSESEEAANPFDLIARRSEWISRWDPMNDNSESERSSPNIRSNEELRSAMVELAQSINIEEIYGDLYVPNASYMANSFNNSLRLYAIIESEHFNDYIVFLHRGFYTIGKYSEELRSIVSLTQEECNNAPRHGLIPINLPDNMLVQITSD